jgi:hypothetical protein
VQAAAKLLCCTLAIMLNTAMPMSICRISLVASCSAVGYPARVFPACVVLPWCTLPELHTMMSSPLTLRVALLLLGSRLCVWP